MLSECGFDWLWIDMEHAPLSLMDVQHMVQAKNETCAALVRIPTNTHLWIKQVLDLGVEGIITSIQRQKWNEQLKHRIIHLKGPEV